MRPVPKTLLLLAGLAVAAPAVVAASADRQPTSAVYAPESHHYAAQQDCLTLSEAVDRVRRQYNGRIVSAETRMSGNREMHIIRVMTEDGKVKTVRIPGCSRGG